ncbi:MAG: hypothetical protein K2W93_03435, partial [Burkholderiaceae bacterium]|nr:hypothetical protein [Burkholderiaceae bacterium]
MKLALVEAKQADPAHSMQRPSHSTTRKSTGIGTGTRATNQAVSIQGVDMNKPTLHLRHSTRATGLPRPLPLCLAIAALCSTGLAEARDLVWAGGNKAAGDPAGSSRMSFNSNWQGQNVQPAEGDILHFGNTNWLVVVNDLGYRVYNQISFETGASAYTLQGVGNNIGLTNGIVNRSSN